jgi:hypothetical protein
VNTRGFARTGAGRARFFTRAACARGGAAWGAAAAREDGAAVETGGRTSALCGASGVAAAEVAWAVALLASASAWPTRFSAVDCAAAGWSCDWAAASAVETIPSICADMSVGTVSPAARAEPRWMFQRAKSARTAAKRRTETLQLRPQTACSSLFRPESSNCTPDCVQPGLELMPAAPRPPGSGSPKST